MTLTILLAALCVCGEAPERANDFFWENERVGFRAYGPGDSHKWSGIDVFNKNTSSNVVQSWLRKLGPACNWHKNVNGLGMDDYAVGPGRGVGGIARRKNGRWLADYGDWRTCRVLEREGDHCAFELDYALPEGGTMTLTISMEKGKSYFREEVSFSPDTPLEGVEVGIGLDLSPAREHVGDVAVDERLGVVSLFEKPHGRPGEEGSMMSAISLARGSEASVVDEPSGAKVLLTRPLTADDANGRPVIAALVGADWTEAGRYRTAAEWHVYAHGFSDRYLDIMEQAVGAYDDARVAAYLAEAERDGVQEHGFPRLAANLGVLIANGRMTEKREALARMMTVACRCAAAGRMPPKSGGNEFSVRELTTAILALERAGAYPKAVTDGWRADISRVDAWTCFSELPESGLTHRSFNWCLFGVAGEVLRRKNGMGGDSAYIEQYASDMLRWFDSNGMYRDPHSPVVYDLVPRLTYATALFYGYDGLSRRQIEAKLDRAAEATLAELSASGEIPYGGRSNQFLHNHTLYAAVCEWYATHYAACGDLETAGRFVRAADRALESLEGWLAERPVRHVKNLYPTESGFGCERYAYFNKYMVTMGSWAMLAREFAAARSPVKPAADSPEPSVFVASPHFHLVFLSAGDYSAQFDYNADLHYDCDGLGRFVRRGAPAAICLTTPCAAHPTYRIDGTNDCALAICPVTDLPLRFDRTAYNARQAIVEWTLGDIAWTCTLSDAGLKSVVTGPGNVALALPAFAFDGRTETQIDVSPTTLTVTYRGWRCRYETDGEIVDTGLAACNRSGRYRRFEARGRKTLHVRTTIERKQDK